MAPLHVATLAVQRELPEYDSPMMLSPVQMENQVFFDAVGLIMYYTKIASSLNHSDALKIRSFLAYTLPDLCYYPRLVKGLPFATNCFLESSLYECFLHNFWMQPDCSSLCPISKL